MDIGSILERPALGLKTAYEVRAILEASGIVFGNDLTITIADKAKLVTAYVSALKEIDRLRSTMEIIAGSATDRLQAAQARGALDNI